MNQEERDKIIDVIPDDVRIHLRGIIKICGIEDNTKNLVRAAELWLAKRGLFDRIIEHGNFQRISTFFEKEKNCSIAITLSGSIVTLGPLFDGVRHLTYTNIGIRTDLGKIYVEPKCIVDGNIEVGKSIIFTKAPIQKTSPIIDIAIISNEEDLDKQFARIKAANNILQKRFIDLNKEFVSFEEEVDLLKYRYDLFKNWIIQDWFRIGGMDKTVFHARTKILWLELFDDLYDFLTDRLVKKNRAIKKAGTDGEADWNAAHQERDQAFMELQNKKFSEFIDVYKWVESEKKDFDIGLLKALEEIPELDKYKDFCKKYREEISKQQY